MSCVEDTYSQWTYYSGADWVADPDAGARCSDCTLYPDNDECRENLMCLISAQFDLVCLRDLLYLCDGGELLWPDLEDGTVHPDD